jgi:hypothetical protein
VHARSFVVLLVAAVLAAGWAAGDRGGPSKTYPDLTVRSVSAPPGASDMLEVRDIASAPGRVRAWAMGYFLSRDRRLGAADRRLSGGRLVTARTRSGLTRLTIARDDAPLGRVFVLACADVSDRVRERDERNNCRASRAPVTILPSWRSSPLDVVETPDRARSLSALVGPAGGRLSVTAGDGARFTLDVLAGTLAAARTVTMTPLSALSGLPPGAALAAAVRLEPAEPHMFEGFLTIEPAAGVPRAHELPFASFAGRDFHAAPSLAGRDTLQVRVSASSTYGLVAAEPSVAETLLRRAPASRTALGEHTVASALLDARRRGAPAATWRDGGYAALFVVANEAVRPLLERAIGDRSLRGGAGEVYFWWFRATGWYGVRGRGLLAALNRRYDRLFTANLRREAADIEAVCGRGGPDVRMAAFAATMRTAVRLGVLAEGEVRQPACDSPAAGP